MGFKFTKKLQSIQSFPYWWIFRFFIFGFFNCYTHCYSKYLSINILGYGIWWISTGELGQRVCVVLIFGDIAKMCSKKCVPIYSLPTVYENTCLPTPPLTLQVVHLLHTYSKILFIVYLKFNFKWASCIFLSSNFIAGFLVRDALLPFPYRKL